jgi:hypothetical protein
MRLQSYVAEAGATAPARAGRSSIRRPAKFSQAPILPASISLRQWIMLAKDAAEAAL